MILAIGRIVGETAALIYTAGTVAKVPSQVYWAQEGLWQCICINLSSEGLYMNQAYATAVVLAGAGSSDQYYYQV